MSALDCVKPSGPISVMATCTKADVPCMSVLSRNVLRCTRPINRSSRLVRVQFGTCAETENVRHSPARPWEKYEKVG